MTNINAAVEQHWQTHLLGGTDPLPGLPQPGDTKHSYGVLADLLARNPGWQLADGTVTLPSGLTPPDMRDRVLIAAGTTYALGATGGLAAQVDHVVTQPNLHSNTGTGHNHALVGGVGLTSPGSGAPNVDTATNGAGAHTHDAHTGTAVNSHGTNLPPYAALYCLIFTGVV